MTRVKGALATGAAVLWALAVAGCGVMETVGQVRDTPILRSAVEKLKSGDEAAAVKQFDSLLARQRGSADAYVLVAAACQEARRFDLSAIYAERGLRETPGADAAQHGRLHSLLGIARQQLGDFERSIESHQAARHLLPDDPGVLNNLAYAYADAPDNTERLQEAVRLATAAIEMAVGKGRTSEEIAIYRDTLGWAQLKLGLLDQATVNLTIAADTLANEPDVLFHLAHAYTIAGRLPEARVMLERAVRADPKHARASRALAELKALEGDTAPDRDARIRRADPK